MLRRLARSTRGATAIEYGLIVSCIVIVMVVGLAQLGASTGGMWGRINDQVTNAS